MTASLWPKLLRPLDPTRSLAALPAAAAGAARGDREHAFSAPTTRCRPSATSRRSSRSRASRCARRSTGWSTEGLLVRRQGSGNFVSARVEKNFAKLTSFSEDMRARGRTPRSVWLQALRGHGDARGSADAAAEPGHAGLPLQSHPLRRRCADGARVRDRRRPRRCRRSRRSTPRSTRRSSAPATARCARCNGCARCCSTPSRRSC